MGPSRWSSSEVKFWLALVQMVLNCLGPEEPEAAACSSPTAAAASAESGAGAAEGMALGSLGVGKGADTTSAPAGVRSSMVKLTSSNRALLFCSRSESSLPDSAFGGGGLPPGTAVT